MTVAATVTKLPCKHCGNPERYVSNGACPTCSTRRTMACQANNRESYAKTQKAWRDANPDKLRAAENRYRAAHREEVLERARERNKRLRTSDPERLRANARRSHMRRIADVERHKRYLEQQKNNHYQRRHGISRAEFLAKIDAQGGRCANSGCAVELKTTGRQRDRAVMDHDHATGRLREVLCLHCNSALGLMADDPARLESAAAYLRKHGR